MRKLKSISQQVKYQLYNRRTNKGSGPQERNTDAMTCWYIRVFVCVCVSQCSACERENQAQKEAE